MDPSIGTQIVGYRSGDRHLVRVKERTLKREASLPSYEPTA